MFEILQEPTGFVYLVRGSIPFSCWLLAGSSDHQE